MDRAESGKIIVRMLEILTAMEYGKPNDRSAADRKWAIAITDYEKAIAVFYWFVVRFDESDRELGEGRD